MKNNRETNVYEIKCANADCSYIVKDIKGEQYCQWINKPCPTCGNILLTEDDYNDAKYLTQIVKLANSVLNEKDDISMNVAINDNGKIDFRIERS